MPIFAKSLFGRFGTVRPRRLRGSGFRQPIDAALECLEQRAMLSAGAVMWSAPKDFSSAEDDYFNDVAVQADGKVVAVGTMKVGADYDFFVARYTAGGQLDLSFHGDGYRTFDFGDGRNDTAYGVAIQKDGKIVVEGTTVQPDNTVSLGLVRFDQFGSRDLTFGGGGQIVQGFPNAYAINSRIALTSDDRIVAIATRNVSNAFVGRVFRYTANGALDASFDLDGVRDIVGSQPLMDVSIDPSGRVVLAGLFGMVTRLTAAGALDTTFSGDGMQQITYEISTGPVANGIGTMADGRVVVAGHSTDGNFYLPGVARLNEDGSYDNTFAGNGRTSFGANFSSNASDYLRDMALLPDGSVVVVSESLSASGDWTVAVLGPNGLLDPKFGTNGFTTRNMGGYDSTKAVAVTRAGHYVVVGRVSVGTADGSSAIAQFEGRYPRRDDALGWTGAGDWWVARSTGVGFANQHFGNWNPAGGWKIVDHADFDGDGLVDVAGRDGNGRWWIGFNTDAGFRTVMTVRWNESAQWRDVRFADFDGDGKADVAGRTYYGEWWVSLSTGSGLADGTLWDRWAEAAQWRDVIAADYDGDGRSDLAGRTYYGEWWVATSNAVKFNQSRWDTWAEAAQWRDVRVGDFNGDGRMDLAGRTYYGEWWVSRSTGLRFMQARWDGWAEAAQWRDVVVGDFNGDGRADIAGRTYYGEWWVSVSNGSRFNQARWDGWAEAAQWRGVIAADFNGDGKTDLAGRTYYGEWWVSVSNGSRFNQARWGSWSEAAGWITFRNEFARTLV